MTDIAVTVGQITDNSGEVFPSYINSMEGYITPEFALAANSSFSPSTPSPLCAPNDVAGAVIGYIGVVGVGGGSNTNNFVVALQGVLPQSYFESVTFTAGGDVSGPQTLNSADASYNGVNTSAPGYTTWVFPTIGAPGTLITPLGSTVTFHNVNTMPTVTLAVPDVIDGSGVLLNWTPSSLGSLTVVSYDVFRNGSNVANVEGDVVQFADQTDQFNTSFTYFIRMHLSDGTTADSNSQTVTTSDQTAGFNCNCETVSEFSTLAELRIRMAIQCGYAAMSANLPAGQAAEFNEYLFSAQKQLYLKFRAQRTERFFNWPMVPGQRYYGLADSEDTSCTLKLDPLGVTWVGFEDLNRAWYRLVEGIDPVYYTRANINFGWPTRYEIRSCIEVFPAPQAAYTLWIKGDIGLAPFASDSDRTTFDDEAVLLFAVANWKSAKGRQDADRCMGQATQRIQDLTARKHATKRYVPSTYVQNPATPPRFLPLGSQQS